VVVGVRPQLHCDRDVLDLAKIVGRADVIPALLASAYRSLRPGGLLIVHDFMLDDDEQGPALAAQWFLLGLALQPDAGSFSAATLSVLLAEQGFTGASSQTLIPQITKVVVGNKPV